MKTFLISLICFVSYNLTAQLSIEKQIQTDFILAENGSIITLPEGTFTIKKTLSMDGKKNITIQGAGIDKTILKFIDQTVGAEGIRITNSENITIKDLTVQDAKGDLIKTMEVKNIQFLRIKAEWTGGPKSTNGSYALYPVLCDGVLIDECIAIGASDAGIYVGQSKNIVVRNCLAYENVAGIEIENSLYAEVHHNIAKNNTGGILIFDLPDLIQKKGGHVKVHHNKVIENNTKNFAPKGNIVASVPMGTGIMVLATNHVDIYENEIFNHKTLGTGIISYFMTELPIHDQEYDPYPAAIYVHDNRYSREKGKVPAKGRFGKLYRFILKVGQNPPMIVWDGIKDPQKMDAQGFLFPENMICIRNNENESFLNLDAENDFKNKSTELTPFNCELFLSRSLDEL